MTNPPTPASQQEDRENTIRVLGSRTKKFYKNPKLLPELRVSRFEGLGLMGVL